MAQLDFSFTNLKAVLRDSAFGARKQQQILAYLPQVKSALGKISTKRPTVILDCCCGKSYLSFVVYAYCTTILKRKIKIIGVDRNQELVEKCKQIATELGFTDMHFHCANLEVFTPNENIDIVYSLHACDEATDLTIATGIKLAARYIFSVSCCQHTSRDQLHHHPLVSVSRHQPYKERLADIISDSMRALLLEKHGYGVDIFEFVAATHTPKNIMLRAVKNSAKRGEQANAQEAYQKLAELMHFSPKLERLLEE